MSISHCFFKNSFFKFGELSIPFFVLTGLNPLPQLQLSLVYSCFEDNTIVFRHTNELRNFVLTTRQRKFLFAALRWFVLGAARLVVFRLVSFGDAMA